LLENFRRPSPCLLVAREFTEFLRVRNGDIRDDIGSSESPRGKRE